MAFRGPVRLYAFVLTMCSGSLLATGRYLAAALCVALAILLLALRMSASSRDDKDRFTI